ncbi:MAG: VanW family protein [Clostridiales bacterium]|jgi:hypothetical protein|nr:VanW family protein [Clostridiales bacterium]
MKKLSLMAAFAVCQVLVALLLGFAAIDMLYHSKTPKGLSYGGADFSGMSQDEAAVLLKSTIDDRIKTQSATISYRDLEFVFRLSEIDLEIGNDSIADEIAAKSELHYKHALLSAFTRAFDTELLPRLDFDGLKLRNKLLMIKGIIDRPPQNANIELVGGKVAKTPASEGISLLVDESYFKLSEAYSLRPFDKSEIVGVEGGAGENGAVEAISDAGAGAPEPAQSGGLEYEALHPDITDDMLSDIDALLAEASTPILPGADAALLAKAAESIEKVWVPKYGMASEPFSLNRYLSGQGIVGGEATGECSQLATTLFVALLRAGAGIGEIDRRALPQAAPYCEDGFGTLVSGESADFMFTNTLGTNIVIFTSVQDGALVVQIAGGKGQGGSAPHEVYSQRRGGTVGIYIDGELAAEVEQEARLP